MQIEEFNPPSPVPVALCITELDRGGAELALCEIAVRLDKSKFLPVVYSLQPRPKNEAASCVPMLEKSGIPVHFLDIRGFGSLLGGFAKLRRLLKSQKPLVLQSFLFHANFLARFAAYSAGVPHVFCGIRVAEKQANWHLFLDRLTSRFVEHYVAVSRSVADFTAEKGKISREKISVIPNGIDSDCFLPRHETKKTPTKRAIFVGRLHPQKGIDWLLETCPHWIPQLPDWELCLVGKGAEQHVQQYEKIRDSLGDLKNRIHFLGWRADIAELLADSDLLLLPSRWEGMPNVLLQAMSCKLPVLATNVEGVVEILGVNLAEPQTVDFGDTEKFCANLLGFANNVDFATEIGQRNRKRVQDAFSLEEMVRSYEKLWESNLYNKR